MMSDSRVTAAPDRFQIGGQADNMALLLMRLRGVS
jgi:hypothetical protein